MKDENCGIPCIEGVFLRPKSYALRTVNDCIKKSKGVKQMVLEAEVKFNDYKNCLFENKELYCNQNLIYSTNHKLYTIQQKRLALSNTDDKRIVLSDGVKTLPYGHKDLKM